MQINNLIRRGLLIAIGALAATIGLWSNLFAGPAELVVHEKPATLAEQPPLVVAQAPAKPQPAEPEDQTELLIMEALDWPTDLRVEDTEIGTALQQLSDRTGIPIEVQRGTMGLLPYGSRTKLTATIEGQPLKESLGALLRPLALKYAVERGRVVVKPRPALARICRRASWDEIATIERLYAEPWSEELLKSLEFQFQGMPLTDTGANLLRLKELAASVGEGSAARVLELACVQYGWEWFPAGRQVVVCTKTWQVERQLDQLVTMKYSGVQLKDVLLDLAGRAGVLLKMDPGVLATLPIQQTERFKLSLENVTIRQALEVIAGETGLGYFIEPEGVRITSNPYASAASSPPVNPQAEAAAAQATVTALRSNPIIGQITIPGDDGTTYSFFLRAEDLPPEVNQLREARIHEAGEYIRKALQALPTTRPQ